RRGWTTGACAAAAAQAAFAGLLTGHFPDPVTIRLPRGEGPSFPLALAERGEASARAGIIKDAGDDPDVTHGALVIAELASAAPGSSCRIPARRGSTRSTAASMLPALPVRATSPRRLARRPKRRCGGCTICPNMR